MYIYNTINDKTVHYCYKERCHNIQDSMEQGSHARGVHLTKKPHSAKEKEKKKQRKISILE